MGKVKKLIDILIQEKAKGNSFQIMNVQMKLLFKGIDCKSITDETPDDPVTLAKIHEVAQSFNIDLTRFELVH